MYEAVKRELELRDRDKRGILGNQSCLELVCLAYKLHILF
jgi:hypothetical protein